MYFRKYSTNEHEDYLKNLIKITTSAVQIINRNPITVESQESNLLEMALIQINEFIFKRFILLLFNKTTLPESISLLGQILFCLFEFIFSLSKIPISSTCLMKSGVFISLIIFALYYKKKLPPSDVVNQVAKKVSLINLSHQ